MTTPPTTFRLPAETLRQLDLLAQVWGSNRTQALSRAIERQAKIEQGDLVARLIAGDKEAEVIMTAQMVRYLQDQHSID